MITGCRRYSTEHCTKARESASALELLVSITIFRKADELDITNYIRSVPMQLLAAMIKRERKLPSMPRENNLYRDTASYQHLQAGITSGVDGWRQDRFGGGDMEVSRS